MFLKFYKYPSCSEIIGTLCNNVELDFLVKEQFVKQNFDSLQFNKHFRRKGKHPLKDLSKDAVVSPPTYSIWTWSQAK